MLDWGQIHTISFSSQLKKGTYKPTCLSLSNLSSWANITLQLKGHIRKLRRNSAVLNTDADFVTKNKTPFFVPEKLFLPICLFLTQKLLISLSLARSLSCSRYLSLSLSLSPSFFKVRTKERKNLSIPFPGFNSSKTSQQI